MTALTTAPSAARDHPAGCTFARYAAIGDGFSSRRDPGVATWTDTLTAHLAGAGSEVQHLNLAQRGATSAQVLKVQTPQALAFGPDLVTVVCGLNDVFTFWPNDFSVYGAHLKRIFLSLREGAPRAVVISATCPNNVERLPLAHRVRWHLINAIELLNEITRSICARLQIPYIDFAEMGPTVDPQVGGAGLSAWATHPHRVSRAFAELLERQVPRPRSGKAVAETNRSPTPASRSSSLAA